MEQGSGESRQGSLLRMDFQTIRNRYILCCFLGFGISVRWRCGSLYRGIFSEWYQRNLRGSLPSMPSSFHSQRMQKCSRGRLAARQSYCLGTRRAARCSWHLRPVTNIVHGHYPSQRLIPSA